jgi:TM2 domain-containing membrane protein YozV
MKSKSTAVAYLFLLLFGFFGAHNFYLGKWIWGLVYLAVNLAGLAVVFRILQRVAQNPEAPFPAGLSGDPFASAASLGFLVVDLFLLWDLVTLPGQVRRCNDGL